MPQTIRVNIVNAFIDSDTGGNPAGVVLNAGTQKSYAHLI